MHQYRVGSRTRKKYSLPRKENSSMGVFNQVPRFCRKRFQGRPRFQMVSMSLTP
jgi:hypothetical protein